WRPTPPINFSRTSRMPEPINNLNIVDITPLPTPRQMQNALPLPEKTGHMVLQTRQAIRDILHGRDPHRLLVIIGPCSIHDPDMAILYAERLKEVADQIQEHALVVLRTYFEKPRTTV